MAVQAGTGEFTDAPEPLVMTAGSDSKDSLASLAKVMSGPERAKWDTWTVKGVVDGGGEDG